MKCYKCGGEEFFDNTEKKATGEYKENCPDFKCKNCKAACDENGQNWWDRDEQQEPRDTELIETQEEPNIKGEHQQADGDTIEFKEYLENAMFCFLISSSRNVYPNFK